jgi:DNA polymerase-1
MVQTLYNSVKFPVDGPDLDNIEKIDLGALPMIYRMQQTGLQVDLNHFTKMSKILKDDMDSLTEKVHDLTGYYINLDSPAQKSDLLFKKLGLKQARPKMTVTGDRESVEEEVLTAILHDHPVVPELLLYAEYSKLKGTYVDPMPKLARRVGTDEWRMFPNFGTTRIPSGRLNCKEPNLLAMPNRSERGRQVCEGFITKPGWVYLSVDESQIEPRICAHRSGDKNLQRVYLNQEDIYSDFAIAAFKLEDKRFKDSEGWHYPGVDKKKHRFPSKTCVLASIYDVSGKGLLEQLPVICETCELPSSIHTCGKFTPLWTEDKCQDLINRFYIQYPDLLKMRRIDHGRARKFGYAWDEWGRLIHAQGVYSVLNWVVSAVLREIGNFPIQSTAQGTVKLTMAQVDDDFVDMKIYKEVYNPLLQIHDELLGEVRGDFAEEIGAHIAGRFETCVKLNIPITAGTAQAENWGTLPK